MSIPGPAEGRLTPEAVLWLGAACFAALLLGFTVHTPARTRRDGYEITDFDDVGIPLRMLPSRRVKGESIRRPAP